MTLRTYLAGPIRDSNDPHGWRDELIEKYDQWEFINPLDYEDASEDSGAAPYHVVKNDKKLIREEADIVFCRWEKGVETAGTPMELVYSYAKYGTPTVVWNTDSDYELSPWVDDHAYAVVTDYQEWFELVDLIEDRVWQDIYLSGNHGYDNYTSEDYTYEH